MKNLTKRKIIEWVTKVLKYYPPMEVLYNTEVFEVKTIQITGHFSKASLPFSKDILKLRIVDSLTEFGILEYSKECIHTAFLKNWLCKIQFQVIKRKIK